MNSRGAQRRYVQYESRSRPASRDPDDARHVLPRSDARYRCAPTQKAVLSAIPTGDPTGHVRRVDGELAASGTTHQGWRERQAGQAFKVPSLLRSDRPRPEALEEAPPHIYPP